MTTATRATPYLDPLSKWPSLMYIEWTRSSGLKSEKRHTRLQDTTTDLKGTQKELDAALFYYEKLKPSCVATVEPCAGQGSSTAKIRDVVTGFVGVSVGV